MYIHGNTVVIESVEDLMGLSKLDAILVFTSKEAAWNYFHKAPYEMHEIFKKLEQRGLVTSEENIRSLL